MLIARENIVKRQGVDSKINYTLLKDKIKSRQ